MGPWLISVAERVELDAWLGQGRAPLDASLVMLVRGDSQAVRELLPNALDAAKLDAGRVVVWARDSALFSAEEARTLFKDDDSLLAVVLGTDHAVRSWVYESRIQVSDATFAFARAAEV